MRRRSRKYLIFVVFLIFLSSYISSSFLFAYFKEVYFTDFVDIIRKCVFADDISCYRTDDSIPNDIYEPNSIYFYQTSCRKAISFRDACSIEAVARIHPFQKVYIISLNNIISDPIIKIIQKLKNVRVSRININKFAEGTPIDDLPALIVREKRKYKALADLLKIVTLYRFGGTVLDWDIVVAKCLKRLGNNWLIKDKDGVSLAMLKLSNDVIGRAAAGMILSNFQTKANHGYVNLKEAVKDTFDELCSASNVKNINNVTCGGYNFYNSKLFHPISYEYRDRYLYPGYPQDSHAYQTWLENIKLLSKDSLYVALARTYCPQIFIDFMYEFVSDY